MRLLVNVIIYQAVWFFCVLGETRGAMLALPLLGVHFVLFSNRKADLKIMALLLLAGLIIDGTLHKTGFISFNQPALPIPLWLAVIWLTLATLPHHSLGWLKGRPLLSALFGALGGPLAYWAGVRLGAASFNWPLVQSLILLAVVWAALWPAVMYIAARETTLSDKRLNRPARHPQENSLEKKCSKTTVP